MFNEIKIRMNLTGWLSELKHMDTCQGQEKIISTSKWDENLTKLLPIHENVSMVCQW